MLLNGETLVCIESFFIFEKGLKYYCSHVDQKHFYIHNKGSFFNVVYIKVPFNYATKFKIVI